MRRAERGRRDTIDSEIDATLVQRCHLVRGQKAHARRRVEHDPVEDVFLGSGDHMSDRANLLTVGPVHRHSGLEHLIGDRQPLIHDTGH